MKNPALRSATISAVKDQVSCTLDGEAVVLHTASGTYFGLNEVGCRVWSIIQHPRSLEEILSELLDEYQVDRACLESDLDEWLRKMTDAGLIQVAAEPEHASSV